MLGCVEAQGYPLTAPSIRDSDLATFNQIEHNPKRFKRKV